MKNKILLSAVAVALFCVGSISAQPKIDGSPKAILQTDQLMSSPVWSPDGKKLAITSLKNTGIWIVDSDGKNLRQITNDLGAGYKMTWASDNSTILSKPFTLKNSRRYFSVKTYNVNTKIEKLLISDVRNLRGTPYFSDNESEVIYNTDKELKKSSSGLITKSSTALKGENLYQKMLADPANITSKASGLSEFAGKTLINPALSPKGDKIVFQIPGEGLFVCNPDASNIKSLGKGQNASWMPDGKYIVVSKTEDDGTSITQSTLHAVNIETGTYTELLSNNLIALRPNVSPKGDKIAFEDYNTGSIYVVNIK